MNPMLRAVLAVIAGVVGAGVIIAMVEAVGHGVYPMPAGMDMSDGEAMRTYVSGLPAGALLFVLAAWLIGTYVGGIVAASIARRPDPRPFTFIVAACVLAGAVYSLLVIPHPTWMLPAAVVLIPAAGVFAGVVTARGFARAAARTP